MLLVSSTVLLAFRQAARGIWGPGGAVWTLLASQDQWLRVFLKRGRVQPAAPVTVGRGLRRCCLKLPLKSWCSPCFQEGKTMGWIAMNGHPLRLERCADTGQCWLDPQGC